MLCGLIRSSPQNAITGQSFPLEQLLLVIKQKDLLVLVSFFFSILQNPILHPASYNSSGSNWIFWLSPISCYTAPLKNSLESTCYQMFRKQFIISNQNELQSHKITVIAVGITGYCKLITKYLKRSKCSSKKL